MDERTLTALRGSIEKWRKIVAGTGVDEGTGNCPLCAIFHNHASCVGCPVSEKSGFKGCAGTPYPRYRWADKGERKGAAAQHARDELAFLIGLLPEGVAA